MSKVLQSPVVVLEKQGRQFGAPFHSHPELELIAIREGSGKCIIGETLMTYKKGDLILLGSGLPHVWINEDETGGSRSVVAYFNSEIFSQEFYSIKECNALNNLFSLAQRGINVQEPARSYLGLKMEKLTRKTGFKKIIDLLDILHLLSINKHFNLIIDQGPNQIGNPQKLDRLDKVYDYISSNYHRDISLEEIAGIAHLAPASFCRLFKTRTHKHFVHFLAEIRVAAACKCLLETDTPVATIGTLCGFKTTSNFYKNFRSITGNSPIRYRQSLKKIMTAV